MKIFVHGFFHADPHPGNIFVLADNILCYIDFGMIGRIGLKSREDFADLILSIAQRNEVKATDALLRLAVYEEEPDYASLLRGVAGFLFAGMMGFWLLVSIINAGGCKLYKQ